METVSIVSCTQYDYERVSTALQRSIENLGGLARFFVPEDKVLLKVNLLMKKTPEEVTTTHPIFVQALADIFIKFGVKEVIIADSPGGPFQETLLRGLYKVTGMTEAAQKSGAVLNYNTKQMEVSNPKGLYLKKLVVAQYLQSATKIVSVSKLKTHGMARMTGAVKNMFGIIPGTLKAEYHLNMPEGNDFANALIDICLYANPVLSFMDGIIAMQGNGPSSGTPRKVGVVLASASPYCLDLAAAHIIHVSAKSVPILANSIKRGLCPKDISKLSLLGEPIERFVVEDFQAPRPTNINPYRGKLPKSVEYVMSRTLKPKPVFQYSLCIGCRDCEKNCPPKAITMKNNRPIVDLDSCIRCFCCQELCPKHAAQIKRPLLFQLLGRL